MCTNLDPIHATHHHSSSQHRHTCGPHPALVWGLRFKDTDEREPLDAMVESMFPLLLDIFKYLTALPTPALQIATLLKLICKIFWSCSYVRPAPPAPPENPNPKSQTLNPKPSISNPEP